MQRIIWAAGLVCIGLATPLEVQAQSCPRGQIFRVSMGVCQPRSSIDPRSLNGGGATASLRVSTEKPAVGDIVLFGSGPPTLLKPYVPKPLAKVDKPRPAAPKIAAPKAAASRTMAHKKPLPVAAAHPAVASASQRTATKVDAEPRQRAPEAVAHDEAVAPKTGEATGAEQPAPAPGPVASAQIPDDAQVELKRPALSAPAPEAKAEPKPTADGGSSEPRAPAPAASHESRAPDASAGQARRDEQVAAVGDGRGAAPAPARPTSSLPDWGDEKKLVEALRANWKSKPVNQTFQRGDEVPPDIPLQPLPPPFASRDAGVNMHYLISKGDAVLVLPEMRIVVDVYHISTAALP